MNATLNNVYVSVGSLASLLRPAMVDLFESLAGPVWRRRDIFLLVDAG
jgi:hypothetical protein